MSALSQAITDPVVRRLAGPQSYHRGLDYFRSGQVASLEDQGESIRAIVRGAEDYTVNLTADDGVLDYSCDCPIGSEGAFCKHCVATAVSWLDSRIGPQAKSKKPSRGKKITLEDADKALQEADKESIVALLLTWAKDDPKLRDRLILFAARQSGADATITIVRRAFEKAVRVRRFLRYSEARAWARGVHEAIDAIEQLLQDGHTTPLIELCDSALQSLVRAAEKMDDSDGHFSTLRDRLQEVHYSACSEARPDPVALAKRLFEWEIHPGFDVFYSAVSRYADILGSIGMTTYRELAEAEWEKVPVRTATDQYSSWGAHSSIRHVMESLAEASGDLEQLISIKSRDLSSPYTYLQIAELYRANEQYGKALLWAEEGLKVFPRPDSRLQEFTANEYHRCERHDDAMKLIWSVFTSQPFLPGYVRLEQHAEKTGAWPEWRERALAVMRSPGDHSRLVEVFLYENNPQQAWLEAQAGGCSDSLWLRLATVREEEHPEDSSPIYLRQAEAAMARIRDSRYEEVIDLLLKAAAVMKRMNQVPQFVIQLQTLCVKYKSRRNFIALVNENKQKLHLT